jgi:hypothetical protein
MLSNKIAPGGGVIFEAKSQTKESKFTGSVGCIADVDIARRHHDEAQAKF